MKRETLGNIIFFVLIFILTCFLGILVAAMLASTNPAYPHDADDPDAAWYNSLQANNGGSCCAAHKDCNPVEYRGGRGVGASYEIKYKGEWIHVPPDAVILHKDNPTGFGVACIGFIDGQPYVRCFIPATEG